MAVAEIEVKIDPRKCMAARSSGRVDRLRSVVVVGKPTETNCALVTAFAGLGHRVSLAQGALPPRLTEDDVVVARLDVLPTLDGIKRGLWRLSKLQRRGVQVMNSPIALLAAHDKLSTALLLGRAGIRQPRTAHVREVSVPRLPAPYVVKPRFGSWGRDVHLCRDQGELRARLERLRRRRWFRRHGAIVQSLVEPTGRDLRIVVAGDRVVGAIERRALPGEWRTNAALGARRRRVSPPPRMRALALSAVAALGLDLAGVDIASDDEGRAYVVEVNGAVEFDATYADDVFAAAAAALLAQAGSRRRSQRRTSPNTTPVTPGRCRLGSGLAADGAIPEDEWR